MDRLEQLEDVFRALGDRTRLRILGLLAGGEVCVCEIHETLKLPQPTVSRHLAYLRHAGLVAGRKEGLWVHYSLANPEDPVLRAILDAAAHWVQHAPSAGRDLARLEKRTGERPRPASRLRLLSCCSPDVERRP
ncbi:MAG TPA: metalloregulator ArsR/SmtB family transcription factor [Vicinamibacterales bacterium]|nr:metalloregulator ArsR/SmtB family transcription factor [Vicinamibacterales bacterium]